MGAGSSRWLGDRNREMAKCMRRGRGAGQLSTEATCVAAYRTVAAGSEGQQWV